jgi:hypothetical protein
VKMELFDGRHWVVPVLDLVYLFRCRKIKSH